MLAAKLHEIFDACGNFDENAVSTLHNFAAALFIGCCNGLVTVAGSLAVRENVMVGERLLQPRQHGFPEVIFDDVSVTVFVDIAQQKDSVREFVEDKFHVLFVEFRETVFRVKFGCKAHLDKERLHVLAEIATVPVFFFELVPPGVNGETF